MKKIKINVKTIVFCIKQRLFSRFTETHRVKNYECGKDGKIKITFIMNLLQDVSENHVSFLGIGVDYCRQQHLAWVASKYRINISS